MRYTRIATGAMVSAVALVGWWGGSASAGPDNKNTDSQVVTMDCGDEDTVVYSGPLELWPPNHKLQPADITATDGGEDNISDATMLDVGDIVPTDMVGGDGGSNHDPDVTYPDGPVSMGDPRATVSVELRSERSGRGEDRTYTINWIAVFDGGEKTCTSADDGQAPFVITVPHDGRRRS